MVRWPFPSIFKRSILSFSPNPRASCWKSTCPCPMYLPSWQILLAYPHQCPLSSQCPSYNSSLPLRKMPRESHGEQNEEWFPVTSTIGRSIFLSVPPPSNNSQVDFPLLSSYNKGLQIDFPFFFTASLIPTKNHCFRTKNFCFRTIIFDRFPFCSLIHQNFADRFSFFPHCINNSDKKVWFSDKKLWFSDNYLTAVVQSSPATSPARLLVCWPPLARPRDPADHLPARFSGGLLSGGLGVSGYRFWI